MSTNKIILRGTITRTRLGGRSNTVIYTLATDGDMKKSSFPEIYHTSREGEPFFNVGDNVTMACHSESGKFMDKNENPVYWKRIVADRITMTERKLKEYFDDVPDDGAMQDDLNVCVFDGRVESVHVRTFLRHEKRESRQKRRLLGESTSERIVFVNMSMDAGGYQNYVTVSCFADQAKRCEEAKSGDRIKIIGAVRTIWDNGKTNFDYVAKDVCLEPV